MLSGCLGAIGMQLAQTVLIQGADKITANIMEAQDRKEEFARHNTVLKDTEPDEYWAAFVTSSYAKVEPTAESLPDYRVAEFKVPTATASQIEVSRLVRVEMWNLLIGDEKRSVLEKARLLGSGNLPPPNEWPNWQVATGALEGQKSQSITFLIPPDFGKFTSGKSALVEISGVGGLHIARYPAN